jgi:hypothetical protein
MTFAGVNCLAILIATVAGFAVGASGRRRHDKGCQQQRKASLTIIDGIRWPGVLVIQGAIIGALGV